MKWKFHLYLFMTVIFIFLENIKALSHGRRVVCYLGYLSVYEDKFDLKEDRDPALKMCTHLVYIAATLNENTYKVISINPAREIDLGGYRKSTAIKNQWPNLSVMIRIVGEYKVMSKMMQEERSRRSFIDSAVQFLKLHSFDGLEISWLPELDDKENFVTFSKELRSKFNENGFQYGIVVPARKRLINGGIDGKMLSKYAHFLSVKTIDYHFNLGGEVGANSPIYSADELSIDFSIQQYLRMGIDPSFLNMGLTTYFTKFALKKPFSDDPRTANITGLETETGDDSLFEVSDHIPYYELCAVMEANNNWTIVKDIASQTPFAIETKRAASMENRESYRAKVEYAMKNKLGGLTFFNLESDDFSALCSSSKGRYPMLRFIDEALKDYSYLAYEDIINSLHRNNAHYFWSGVKL